MEFIKKFIEEEGSRFIEISDRIWELAELPFEEYRSAELLIDELEKEGFTVERGVSGIDTAFIGSYGSGKPVFGFLGEYDALDGLSQASGISTKSPIVENNPGHGCGHNLLGSGSLGATIALKKYMEKNNIEGTLKYFGCAAEEGEGAKIFMARDGYFKDVDFVYTWHPSTVNRVQSKRNIALMSAYFTFTGKTSHAGSTPWLGRSALDAAEIMNIGSNFLREHMGEKERIHYAYLDAGGTAANVVQDRAVIKYEVRSPNYEGLKKLFERVVKCAKGAAMMTETQVKFEIKSIFMDYIPNPVLGKIADKVLEEAGAPNWSEEDYKFAREIFNSLDDDAKEVAQESAMDQFLSDRILEKPLHSGVEEFVNLKEYETGSTDVGNVCYECPTLNINIATETYGTPGHTWQIVSQSKSSISNKGLLKAIEVLTISAINTLKDPDAIEEAKEFVISTRGEEYVNPLPDYVMPPV